jgi:hypothetical protein
MQGEDGEDLEFEDPFSDEEEEDDIIEEDDDVEMCDEDEDEEEAVIAANRAFQVGLLDLQHTTSVPSKNK